MEPQMPLLNFQTVQIRDFRFSCSKLLDVFTKRQIAQMYKALRSNNAALDNSVLSRVFNKGYSAILEFSGKKIVFTYRNQNSSKKQVTENLLIRIADVHFINLQVMNINKTAIHSIQPLSFINAPHLRCLQLHDNDIHSLQPLQKSYFPRLQIITFYHNPITKIDKLSRIRSKRLNGYEFDNYDSYPNRVEDYRFLLKTENINLRKITLNDGKRINMAYRILYRYFKEDKTFIGLRTTREYLWNLLQQYGD